MPIDLYGSRPIDITQDVAQQAIQANAPTKTSGAYGSSMKYYSQKLGEAVNAWGMDAIMDWKNKGAMMEKQFRDDLEEMRLRADQARRTNDMEQYGLLMQRILFDKQMLAHAENLRKNNIHSLIAGMVQGVGQIAGGVVGEYGGRKKEREQMMQFEQWLKQMMNEMKMNRSGPWGQ